MDIFALLFLFALPDFCIFVEDAGYHKLLPLSRHRYYISKQETEWGNSTCTLALPNLDYNDLGIFAETEKDTNWTLPEGGLWIGLFQAQLSFAYVGCNKLNDSGALLAHNISECRWKSGCDTFAIRKKDDENIECKCLNSSVVASESKCTSTCKAADAYKCGKEGQDYFSIYTVQNATRCFKHCGYASKRCLNRIRYNSIIWSICRQPNMQNIVCSDRPFTDMNGSVRDIGTEVSSSADAGEKCFAEGLFPATLRHIESSMISNSSTYWTSIIRMNSMIRTDKKFYTDGPRLYAYIKFDGHRLGVKFDDGRSSIRRKSLCETPTFVTTTATTKEGDTTSTLNFPETTEDTRTIPKATTTEGHPTSKIPETTETSSTKPKVDQRVPVVEISASVLALIGFGILIVIILRKRGWLRCFDDSKNENKESPVKFTNTDCTESQTRDGPKADQDQGYSMTEDMPTKNKTSGKGQMMCDYVDVNNMSVTKNIPRNIQHTANVHNNVNQGLEVYDHLKHFGMQDHDISQPIHDYDSTTATFSGNQDDTYNHLSMNESPNHRRNTDNVYGVQNKGELDQIYNQLNERPERKHTLENIYGLQDKNETEYDTTVETPVTCKDRSEKTTGVNYDKVNKNW